MFLSILIDLIRNEAILYTSDDGSSFEFGEIPDDLKEIAAEYRLKLMEEVASYDEVLLEKYLSDEEILPDEIKSAIRKATIDGTINKIVKGFVIPPVKYNNKDNWIRS